MGWKIFPSELLYLICPLLYCAYKSYISEKNINSNKAGLFEGSFSGGGQFDTPHPNAPPYFKKKLTNINITLYNC